MVKRNKEDKIPFLVEEEDKAVVKQNKKLDKLNGELSEKWNVLNKFLTVQGLGQNARGKVVNLVNELHAIRNKIIKEEE